MIRIICLILVIKLITESSFAIQFESKGKSIAKILGTKKAKVKKVNVDSNNQKVPVYFQKGKIKNYAVIQKRIYKPNCSHTWVIGLNTDAKITDVRVVEMSCPHAFPTNKAAFLNQFKGKGPADLKRLDKQIHAIAKATGTSELTTDAVKVAIQAVNKIK